MLPVTASFIVIMLPVAASSMTIILPVTASSNSDIISSVPSPCVFTIIYCEFRVGLIFHLVCRTSCYLIQFLSVSRRLCILLIRSDIIIHTVEARMVIAKIIIISCPVLEVSMIQGLLHHGCKLSRRMIYGR